MPTYSRGDLPPFTDWFAVKNGTWKSVVAFVKGREDDGGRERRVSAKGLVKYEAQLELVKQERRRMPEPPTRPPRALRLRGLGYPSRTCRSCGRRRGYVVVDHGQVWREGWVTERCRYCLCWRQKQIVDE